MPTRTTQTMGLPAWVADYDSLTRDGGHQVDWANVGERYKATPGQVVRMAAAALADSATITVDPLEFDLPSGTLLYFGQLGETVRTTALEPAGETTIAVEADHTAIEDNDEATVVGSGAKFLPSGTVCGTLLGDGKISPRVDTTNPATCILLTDAREDSRTDSRTGYGVVRGGVIYENLLPEATGTPPVLATAVKTELNANGTGFSFSQYGDSSAA